jgi:hypothetical protein
MKNRPRKGDAMKRNRLQENTPRVVATALAFFGGLAALGYAEGVFARLGTGTALSLAVFAVAYAVLTYRLDPGVRRFVNRLFAPRATIRKATGGRAATT